MTKTKQMTWLDFCEEILSYPSSHNHRELLGQLFKTGNISLQIQVKEASKSDEQATL
jgi:hypothetical protein